jgi:hypothetical protein
MNRAQSGTNSTLGVSSQNRKSPFFDSPTTTGQRRTGRFRGVVRPMGEPPDGGDDPKGISEDDSKGSEVVSVGKRTVSGRMLACHGGFAQLRAGWGSENDFRPLPVPRWSRP